MCRVAAVTERCDWPKEAGSRSKAVRCLADCTQLCPGAAQQPGSPSSSATAVVDVELLARENPGLVLAQESHHSCSADAQHVAEVPAPALLSLVCAWPNASQRVLCGDDLPSFLYLLSTAHENWRLTESICLRRQCRELGCVAPTRPRAFWC